MKKTQIAVLEVIGSHRKHYKSITLEGEPLQVWRAIGAAISERFSIDIERTRSQRKRKGGKKHE